MGNSPQHCRHFPIVCGDQWVELFWTAMEFFDDLSNIIHGRQSMLTKIWKRFCFLKNQCRNCTEWLQLRWACPSWAWQNLFFVRQSFDDWWRGLFNSHFNDCVVSWMLCSHIELLVCHVWNVTLVSRCAREGRKGVSEEAPENWKEGVSSPFLWKLIDLGRCVPKKNHYEYCIINIFVIFIAV